MLDEARVRARGLDGLLEIRRLRHLEREFAALRLCQELLPLEQARGLRVVLDAQFGVERQVGRLVEADMLAVKVGAEGVEVHDGLVVYGSTVREGGFWWANPFFSNAKNRFKISLRARTLLGERLKVNDRRGNPIEIAAMVVWHVQDTAQAMFDVDDFETYVTTQAETALRHVGNAALGLKEAEQFYVITDKQENVFSRSMVYDDLDRLKSVSAPAVWGMASYTYDAADNLRSFIRTAPDAARMISISTADRKSVV